MGSEIWKPIKGFEGLYEVSNLGRIKNRYKVLNNDTNNRGYKQIRLSKDKRKYPYLVHRLVAFAFCEKPEGCNVVNHIDNNPANNNANNLEWVTQKRNLHHAAEIGKFTIKGVIRSDGKTEVYYPSLCATEADGFTRSCVCECCQGKLKTYKGYKWRYATQKQTSRQAPPEYIERKD